jgi:site-specific recombinase XerC
VAICADFRRYIGDKTSGPLFSGRGSERITTRHVQRRLAGWLRLAKIPTPASPHWFRHAAAMRIYRTTRDVAVVQAALCHRSITSTLIYARAASIHNPTNTRKVHVQGLRSILGILRAGRAVEREAPRLDE